MKEKIILISGGGHAKVIISIIKKMNDFRIIGYTDPDNHGDILGVKYLGGDDLLRQVTRYRMHVKENNFLILPVLSD